jgi:dihydroorotase-like cyclic amidohydrolase
LQGADDGFLYDAMRRIGRFPNGIALAHCENSEIADRLARQLQRDRRDDLTAWTEARPGWTEGEAIQRAGIIARNAECPLYVVHVSSKAGIEAIEELRAKGVQVYAEVCAHHLSMTVDQASESLGSLAKVNPPLRVAEDVEALWDGIRRGVVDTVGTDHVPHTRQKAAGRALWDVMPGFSGSATMLPVLITEGYHKRGIPLRRIAALSSRNAARLFRLSGKGEIVPGAEASLTLVDVNAETWVEPSALQSVADFSLYEGRPLKGFPSLTLLRGKIAMQNGTVYAQPGDGHYVRR